MNRVIVGFLVIILSLVIKSCDTTDPPDNKTLTLKLEDVSCTEAWITLTTTNLQLPTTVTLKQNDQFHSTINLVKADTLLYIDSLFPNQVYQFQSVIQSINLSSNELNVTTLDTTSQNFTFEILEFGDGFESSYFNDVWVFSENNIWVCGYIYDTTFGRRNLMHWNGTTWEPLGIQFNSSGIDGVWAFDSSNIYFAAGFIIKYENGNFIEIDISNLGFTNGQRVEKLWGSSQSNIYGVGPWGTIVYYNGVRWTKIEFDTQWYFYNITGNEETGVAYAVAINQVDDCVIVKIDNSNVSIFYQKSLSDIKVSSRTITELNNYLYISGFYFQNLICRLNDKGDIKTIHVLPLTLGVRQSFAFQSNDIFYAGEENSEARLVHFNGVNYKIFDIPQIDPDNYGGMHAIKDFAISVGFTNNKAYLIIVRRSP